MPAGLANASRGLEHSVVPLCPAAVAVCVCRLQECCHLLLLLLLQGCSRTASAPRCLRATSPQLTRPSSSPSRQRPAAVAAGGLSGSLDSHAGGGPGGLLGSLGKVMGGSNTTSGVKGATGVRYISRNAASAARPGGNCCHLCRCITTQGRLYTGLVMSHDCQGPHIYSTKSVSLYMITVIRLARLAATHPRLSLELVC